MTDTSSNTIQLTNDELADVFRRWDIAYRADPDRFQDAATRILKGQTVEEYGFTAAATFLAVLDGEFDDVDTSPVT